MTKSRLFLYIIAGGYVAYTGLGLSQNALAQRPDNYMIYLFIGVLFVAVGGFLAVYNARKLLKGDYVNFAESGPESDQQESINESEQEGGADDEDRNGI